LNRNNHICAKEANSGSCGGDSGGPLVTEKVKYIIIYLEYYIKLLLKYGRYYLKGIVSFGPTNCASGPPGN